jgi:hypothetical protein
MNIKMDITASKSQMEEAIKTATEQSSCTNLIKLTRMIIDKKPLKVPVNTTNPRATLTYDALRNGMIKRYKNIITKNPQKKEDPHYKLIFALLGIDVTKL